MTLKFRLVRLKLETAQHLETLKIIPRETYDSVIQRLLKEAGK